MKIGIEEEDVRNILKILNNDQEYYNGSHNLMISLSIRR